MTLKMMMMTQTKSLHQGHAPVQGHHAQARQAAQVHDLGQGHLAKQLRIRLQTKVDKLICTDMRTILGIDTGPL